MTINRTMTQAPFYSALIGAAIGGLLLGTVPQQWLLGLLAVVLLVSAIKTFGHLKK